MSWKNSVSLVLLAPGRGKGIGQSMNVLMVKRSSKSKFMPNLYVFPGGVVEDVDFSNDWLHFPNLRWTVHGGMDYKAHLKLPIFTASYPSKLSIDAILKLTAIRECFEESGIFISNDDDCSAAHPSRDLAQWRPKVHRDSSQFIPMCRELNLSPRVSGLIPFSNWLTPSTDIIFGGSKRRYDAMFYLTCIDHMPIATHDHSETSMAEWVEPFEMLGRYFEGTIGLAPPQFVLLWDLVELGTYNKVRTLFTHFDRQHMTRTYPVFCACSDGITSLYPGDSEYPKDVDFEATNLRNVSMTLAEFRAQSQCVYRGEFVNNDMRNYILYRHGKKLDYEYLKSILQSRSKTKL